MDDFIQDYLPHNLQTLLSTQLAPYAPYLLRAHALALRTSAAFYTYIYPLLYPAYALLQNLLTNILSPSSASSSQSQQTALFTLLALALTTLLLLKLLNLLRRAVVYWIRLGVSLVLWGFVLAAAAYIWRAGLEKSLEDAGWLVGVLWELGQEGERRGRDAGGRRMRESARVGREAQGMRGGGRAGQGYRW